MIDGVTIRRMERADFSAVLGLFDRVAAERMWIGTEPGFDRALYRANWERWIGDPRFYLCVALEGEEIVGQLTIVPDPEGFEVGMLVAPDHRGRGVGTALMTEGIRWAREHEIALLQLNVFPHNAPARALYRKMGFIEVEEHLARIRRTNGEVWDVIHMRKDLT